MWTILWKWTLINFVNIILQHLKLLMTKSLHLEWPCYFISWKYKKRLNIEWTIVGTRHYWVSYLLHLNLRTFRNWNCIKSWFKMAKMCFFPKKKGQIHIIKWKHDWAHIIFGHVYCPEKGPMSMGFSWNVIVLFHFLQCGCLGVTNKINCNNHKKYIFMKLGILFGPQTRITSLHLRF
jgi:hypothetical protein